MEPKLKTGSDLNPAPNLIESTSPDLIPDGQAVIQTINLSSHHLGSTLKLSGVLCDGVQYYDLKNTLYINNTGLANLIDLLKSLVKQGIALQFVNVNEKIKEKIKASGLERVLNCG